MEEKKSYSTQVLLSMNMDRLKEYMDGMSAGPDTLMCQETGEEKKKRISKMLRRDQNRNAILVRPDSLGLSRLIAVNDRRMVLQRYSFSWGESFGAAVSKMCVKTYRTVVIYGGEEKIEGLDRKLAGTDFIMLLQGLAPRDDAEFLLKKREFVRTCVPGASDAEKVATFRLLKESYRNVPVLYLAAPGEKPARALSQLRAVTLIEKDDEEFSALYSALDRAREPSSPRT